MSDMQYSDFVSCEEIIKDKEKTVTIHVDLEDLYKKKVFSAKDIFHFYMNQIPLLRAENVVSNIFKKREDEIRRLVPSLPVVAFPMRTPLLLLFVTANPSSSAIDEIAENVQPPEAAEHLKNAYNKMVETMQKSTKKRSPWMNSTDIITEYLHILAFLRAGVMMQGENTKDWNARRGNIDAVINKYKETLGVLYTDFVQHLENDEEFECFKHMKFEAFYNDLNTGDSWYQKYANMLHKLRDMVLYFTIKLINLYEAEICTLCNIEEKFVSLFISSSDGNIYPYNDADEVMYNECVAINKIFSVYRNALYGVKDFVDYFLDPRDLRTYTCVIPTIVESGDFQENN